MVYFCCAGGSLESQSYHSALCIEGLADSTHRLIVPFSVKVFKIFIKLNLTVSFRMIQIHSHLHTFIAIS